jgi:hypothetical protein
VGGGRQDQAGEPQAERARQIVGLVAGYVVGGAAAFETERGARALEVTQEIMAALMGQLEGNLGHVVLWEQFLRTPTEVSEALVGVIEALLCRSPALSAWVEDAWARYRACAGE